MQFQKYTRKPVEAFQFLGQPVIGYNLLEWPSGNQLVVGTGHASCAFANVGDYIVKDGINQFVLTQAQFEAAYQIAE